MAGEFSFEDAVKIDQSNSSSEINFDQAAKIESNQPVKERGFLGDAASHLARGTVNLLDTTANAVDTLTPGGSKLAQNASDYLSTLPQKASILRPDESEAAGNEGMVKKGFSAALESAPQSLAIMPAAIAGAKVGGLAGSTLGPVGAAVGATAGGILGGGAAMLSLFGAGQYGQRKKEVTDRLKVERPDLGEEQINDIAHENAMTHAKAEVLGESAGDLAGYLIFSKLPGGNAMYKGGKAILQELANPGAIKAISKGLLKDMPFEVGSEVGTSYFQNEADVKAGIADQTTKQAMIDSVIPAMFLSTGMGVAVGGYAAHQRNQAYKSLNDGTPEQRAQAVNAITGTLAESTDENIATRWREAAMSYVQAGKEIPLDPHVADLAAFKPDQPGEPTETAKPAPQQSEAKGPLTRAVASLSAMATAPIDNLAYGDLVGPLNDRQMADEWTMQEGRSKSYLQTKNRQQEQEPTTPAQRQRAADIASFNESYNAQGTVPPSEGNITAEEAAKFEQKVQRERMLQRKREQTKQFVDREVEASKALQDLTIPQEVKTAATKQARDIASSDPVYSHMEEAKKRGGLNLKDFGQDYDAATISMINRRYPGIFSQNGKIRPDEFAGEMGYQNLDDMVQRFSEARTKKELIGQIIKEKTAEWKDAEQNQQEYFANMSDRKSFPGTIGVKDGYVTPPPRTQYPASDEEISQSEKLIRSFPDKFGEDYIDHWTYTADQQARLRKALSEARSVTNEQAVSNPAVSGQLQGQGEGVGNTSGPGGPDGAPETGASLQGLPGRDQAQTEKGGVDADQGQTGNAVRMAVNRGGEPTAGAEGQQAGQGEFAADRQRQLGVVAEDQAATAQYQGGINGQRELPSDTGAGEQSPSASGTVEGLGRGNGSVKSGADSTASSSRGTKTADTVGREQGSDRGMEGKATGSNPDLQGQAGATSNRDGVAQNAIPTDQRAIDATAGDSVSSGRNVQQGQELSRQNAIPSNQPEVTPSTVKESSTVQPKTSTKGEPNGEVEKATEARPETGRMLNKEPHQEIADKVKAALGAGQRVRSPELFRWANEAYGGKQSEGKYTPKDAYDALELGINQYLADGFAFKSEDPQQRIAELEQMLSLVPTQTKRTKEQDDFQQYSTPPPLAFVAEWVANVGKSDTVLEPSAGIGGIAVFAKIDGAKEVIVNELSERRREILKAMGFDRVFGENAEQLNNVLPDGVRPSVVLMNPPFSATAGRVSSNKTKYGAAHIEQALKRLDQGGRLVAIVGEGMAADRSTFRDWWRKISSEYTVRANVGMNGEGYRKYGTTFDNQLLVIDKTGATTDNIITGKVDNYADLIPLLQGVRNERSAIAQQPASEQAGTTQTDRGQTGSKPGETVPAPTSSMGAGQRNAADRSGSRSNNRPDGIAISSPVDVTGDQSRPGRGASNGNQRQETQTRTTGMDDAGRDREPAQDTNTLATGRRERTLQQSEDSTVENYQPTVVISGAKPHPADLIESAAMAAVSLPNISYQPRIPKQTVDKGLLSEVQLEAIAAAGQAHQDLLPNGERRGFFIGDGTGVGKGREISGILWDNWNQGRKRSIWVSKDRTLANDAQRDMAGVGWDKGLLIEQGQSKAGESLPNKDGVLFTAYSTVSSKAKPGQKSRLDSLVEWAGEDFDGVIAFDESHKMGNAIALKDRRYTKQPSQMALAALELQKRLPKARVVYVSATGATEISNLAYANRLGLWGEGTAFPNVTAFIGRVSQGGIAAMEVVARDMKAMGSYLARKLAFNGKSKAYQVKYKRLEHKLTKDQSAIYDELAKAWQGVLSRINEALALTEANGEGKGHAMSAFWGSHQRFFNQVLTAMQMPSVITSIRQDIAEGKAVVLQITNTNEASTTRALANADSLDDVDITPRDALMQMVQNSFPIQQYEEYEDEDGNRKTRPVVDSNGNPVVNREALAMRERLLDKLGSIRVPDAPLEQILNTFGVDNVAEVTGRSKRVVTVETEDGKKKVRQSWSKMKGVADAALFMADKKKILVFSEAGGTGASYHADLKAINQRQRSHYILQAGWRADSAIQGLGRSHRSNQAVAPEYVLVTTNLKGHMRFISSIARRLAQLGALTEGERKASSQGLFSERDNLESVYATDAVEQLVDDVHRGKTPGMTMTEFAQELGLPNLVDEHGNLNAGQVPSVTKFLNRILSMTIETQNRVFDLFSDRLDANIERAERNGTLDQGLETIKALNIKEAGRQTVYTDQKSGAETQYVQLDVERETFKAELKRGASVRVNNKSGAPWFVQGYKSVTNENGNVVDVATMINPRGNKREVPLDELDTKFTKVDGKDAATAWNKAKEEIPDTTTTREHLITGALLPIWDKLKGHPRIVRVSTGKETMLGRLIPGEYISEVMAMLDVEGKAIDMTSQQIASSVVDGGQKVSFDNGWKLERRRVADENRIEIVGPEWSDYDRLIGKGAFTERINYRTRIFIPTGEQTASVLDAIISSLRLKVMSVNKGDALYSKTKVSIPPENRADIEGEMRKFFGGVRTRRLLNSGLVKIVDSSAEISRIASNNPSSPLSENNDAIQALYHNGTVYLNREGLEKGAVMPVLLHDMGEHAFHLGFSKDERYLEILKSIERRKGVSGQVGNAIREAMARVPEDTKQEHYWSEVAGYIVENEANTKITFFDRLFSFFKNMFFKVTGFGADSISHKDLVIFAKAAVRAAAREGGVQTKRNEDVLFSRQVLQAISSAATSLNQIAAVFKKGLLKPGTTNVDIGGGKYDSGTTYLASIGVENLIFDPFNRGKEHNDKVVSRLSGGLVDTATVNNVLNVIKEDEIRTAVIRQAAKAIKKNGTAYFQIHEGDGDGNSRVTKMVNGTPASWQNHQRAEWYVKDIEQFFGSVTRKGNVIIAAQPIKDDSMTVWSDGTGSPMFSKSIPQTATKAFKDWFGASKIKTNGEPAILYHGTTDPKFLKDKSYPWVFDMGRERNKVSSDFAGLGIFLGTQDAANAYIPFGEQAHPFYVRMEKPFVTTTAELEAKLKGSSPEVVRKRLQDLGGYDGIIIKDRGHAVVFNPNQVKSAQDNTGEFSRSNNDVRYSKRMSPEQLEERRRIIGEEHARIVDRIANEGLNAASEEQYFKTLLGEGADTVPTEDAGIKTKARDWFTSLPKATARKALGALTLRQLRDVFAARIPQMDNFYQATRSIAADANKIMTKADEVYNQWMKLDKANAKTMSELMIKATVSGVNPDAEKYEPRANLKVLQDNIDRNLQSIIDLGKEMRTASEKDKIGLEEKQHRLREKIKKHSARMENEVQRYKAYKELSPVYQRMSKDAKDVYQAVKKMYTDNLNDLFSALEERINRQIKDPKAKKATMDAIRLKYDSYIAEGPYFPLSRFGDYIAIAEDGGTGRREVRTFDSMAERTRYTRERRRAGWNVQEKTAREFNRETAGASSYFVEQLFDIIENKTDLSAEEKNPLKDEINQLFIKSMPDLSHRKHFAHRQKVEGYSRDQMRAFADNMQHAAHHIARIRHADKMEISVKSILDESKMLKDDDNGDDFTDLYNELNARIKIMNNPDIPPVTSALTAFGFVMNIGPSIASAMVNMSQTPLVAYPILATRFKRTGAITAFKEFTRASADYFTSKPRAATGPSLLDNPKIKQAEKDMLKALIDDGTIDVTQAHSLAQAAGSDFLNLARTKYGHVGLRAMRLISYPFHVAELANRKVTALAAYRLAIKNGMSHTEAIAETREIVLESHFDYSQSNRARWMEGKVNRVLLLFKQYSQQMTWLLGRSFWQAAKGETPEVKNMARKRLAMILGGHFALAGMNGMPVLGGVIGTLEFIAAALGDDDEPKDFETAIKNFMADNFGKDTAEAAWSGPWRSLPGLGELDMSSRVSLGDLWFRAPEKEAEGKDKFNQYVNLILGPVATNASNVFMGLNSMAEGETWRGVEMMLPKAIKDGMKAVRYSREGVKNWNGDTLREDLSAMELIGQSIGFSSSSTAEMYSGANAIKNYEHNVNRRRQILMNRYIQSVRNGESGAAEKAMENITAFNSKNPEFGITRQQLVQSYKQRQRVSSQTKDGAYLPATKEAIRSLGRFANI